jgi:hypothetical protein
VTFEGTTLALTLSQRRSFLERVVGAQVSESTISRAITRLGWSRNKAREYCDHGARDVSPCWSDPKKWASCLSTDPSICSAGVAAPPVGVGRDLMELARAGPYTVLSAVSELVRNLLALSEEERR